MGKQYPTPHGRKVPAMNSESHPRATTAAFEQLEARLLLSGDPLQAPSGAMFRPTERRP